jgi:hypothetical protein
MSPKFSQYVDPIIEQLIDLLIALETDTSRSGKGEWNKLVEKFKLAQKELAPKYGRTWEFAKYALAAWADESVRNTEGWPGRQWWLDNSLEFHLCDKALVAHEMFFVNAKEAKDLENGDDALETFYVCGMLGFRGFYGQGDTTDSELIHKAAIQYGLPPSFADWAREVGNVIRERRRLAGTAASAEQRERRIITAKPMWSRLSIVWPWLLVVGLTIANVVAGYHWYFKSSTNLANRISIIGAGDLLMRPEWTVK